MFSISSTPFDAMIDQKMETLAIQMRPGFLNCVYVSSNCPCPISVNRVSVDNFIIQRWRFKSDSLTVNIGLLPPPGWIPAFLPQVVVQHTDCHDNQGAYEHG